LTDVSQLAMNYYLTVVFVRYLVLIRRPGCHPTLKEQHWYHSTSLRSTLCCQTAVMMKFM